MVPVFSSRSAQCIRFLCLLLFLSSLTCRPALADDPDKTLGDILSSAESMFKAMQVKNYGAIWNLLTATTRSTIIDDTGKAIAKAGGKEISKD